MSQKRVVITQSNYIPWRGYFDAIRVAEEVILLDEVQFTKRDWRNRNQIKTPQGAHWLTIPVQVKGKYSQTIRETKVSDATWADNHWKTIANYYAKARHFKEFKPLFEELYRGCSQEYLSEINYSFIKVICEILKINTRISWSSDYTAADGKTERLVDICKKIGATDYYSGPAAKAYIDPSQFSAEGIALHFFDYSGYQEYTQLHGPFISEVSVLDLIFNEGPNALQFMKDLT